MPECAQFIHLAEEISLVMRSLGQYLGVSSLFTLQERNLCLQFWASLNI